MVRVAVVVGVGPGIGSAVTKALVARGFSVAVFARSEKHISSLASAHPGKIFAFQMDATNELSVATAFGEMRKMPIFDLVEVFCYNCGARRLKPYSVMHTSSTTFVDFWKINCLGAFLCTKQIWSEMEKAGRGTVIFTGATGSVRGSYGRSDFAPGKFGLRALAQTLNAESCSNGSGIHVCHVIVDGPVDMPLIRQATGRDSSKLISPEAVAEMYMHIIEQPSNCWTSEFDIHIPAKL